MALSLARKAGNLSGENREDASSPEGEAGPNHHPRNGQTNQRVATRGSEMRLGSGILFRERPKIPKPRGNKNRCNRQLRGLRATRCHRLYNALELSTMAMHPVRSTGLDGWQHDSLQTLQHNTPIRTGPPEHLRVNRVHSGMLQRRPRKHPSSQLPNGIGHHSYLIYRQRERGTNRSSSSEQSTEKIRSGAWGQRPLHSS